MQDLLTLGLKLIKLTKYVMAGITRELCFVSGSYPVRYETKDNGNGPFLRNILNHFTDLRNRNHLTYSMKSIQASQ